MKPRSVNEVLRWVVIVLAFSVPMYRAWLSLAAILVLLLWFFQGGLGDRLRRLARHRLTLAVLVFLAVNLISLLWSDHPASGFEYWRKYLYLLLIPAIASSVDRATTRRAALAFFAGSVLAVSMMPVVILGDLHLRGTHPGNPAVTMSHLDFSIVLAVAATLVVVHLAFGSNGWRSKLGWTAALLVFLGGLVLNIGRSGQLAVIATMIILVPFLLHGRRWWIRAGAAIAVVVIGVGIYLVVPRFQSRIDAGADEVYRAVVHREIVGNQGKRVAGMIVGLEIVRSHPLVGTGIGSNMPEFRYLLDTEFPELKEAIGWFPHMHNQYLQVVTELGLLGLASLLGIFVALFGGRYLSPEFRSAAVALGCVYLVGFFGDPYLHKQIPLALFALAAGVISSGDEAFAEPAADDVDRRA
jgi:O-antigen ligase